MDYQIIGHPTTPAKRTHAMNATISCSMLRAVRSRQCGDSLPGIGRCFSADAAVVCFGYCGILSSGPPEYRRVLGGRGVPPG